MAINDVRQLRDSLTSGDRRSLVSMAAVVVGLHVVGFGILLGFVAPEHFRLGGDHPVFTVGVGVLAYVLGMRHAFDVDHIVAVDNTTRALLQSRKPGQDRPLSVGFWFSLGHSTVVFVLAAALALGVKALVGQVGEDSSALHTAASIVGPSVSGFFLLALGLVNLGAVLGILRIIGDLRRGEFDEAALEEQLQNRGFIYRLIGGLTNRVRRPRQIYPIGVLFGLGFDTATEVGLLVLAGGAAAFDLPFWAVLVLPILFAAGMALFDTVDGVLMAGVYGWAFGSPVRKVFYNLAVTSLSVTVALAIGTIELVGVLVQQMHIASGPLAAIAGVSLDRAGYVIVGMFLIAWALAAFIWRVGKIEARWSGELGRAAS